MTNYRKYSLYCPKAFIQIGDVRGTLQDRSIVVRIMERAEPRERYSYDVVRAGGNGDIGL